MTTDVASGSLAYQNRFPYVSTAFPFKGKGAKHVGRLGKCVIESKQHEERMRGIHGMAGENKIVDNTAPADAPIDQRAANRAFYGR